MSSYIGNNFDQNSNNSREHENENNYQNYIQQNKNLDQFGRQKSNIYSVHQQYRLQKALDKDKQTEDLWNKSLLGFFLSVYNSQTKTSNAFYKKYKLLRVIIWKLIDLYAKNGNGQFGVTFKGTRSAANQYSYKVKEQENLLEQSSSSEDEQKKKGSTVEDGELSKKSKRSGSKTFSDTPGIGFDSNGGNSPSSRKTSIKKKGTKGKDGEKEQITEDKNAGKSNTQPPSKFFKTIHEVNKMKAILRSELATSFNTNLLKIALNFGEDRIAALIVARFPVILDETILKYAVTQKSMIFIHNVFFYNKNYLVPQQVNKPTQEDDYDDEDEEEKLVRFSLESLIKLVHSQYDFHDAEAMLDQILSWRMESDGNILKLLCEVGHERVASKFMKYHEHHSNWDFFFYCVMEEKQYFLKNALRNQYFDTDYMHQERLTFWLMERLKEGRNLLYPLNLLLFTEFKKWSVPQLRDFTKVAKVIVTPNLENNYMLITYNPVMTLSLMIQFLKHIKKQCAAIIKKMEVLGKITIDSMSYDMVEAIFMEKDFTERSVLNIITDNKIMNFIVINKLKFLLDKIWDGKDSSMIDGKTSHFSRTKYLLHHEIKQLKGVQVTISDLVGDSFKPNIEDFNFIYQKKFRSESILIIFIKDFICATLLALAFQYINYLYLNLFTQRRYINADTYEEKAEIISTNLVQYREINFLGTVLSISYFISFGGRIIYNMFSRRKINTDLWMIFDLAAGAINIFAFNFIGNATVDAMINQDQKRFYDYYMILVLIISWLRFFSYFLVINSISKVTITLFKMLRETLSFMIILTCYLALMTTIFATLFRDVNTSDAKPYKQLNTTFREMINYFLANYTIKEMANYETSHSILVIVHVVISFIFLMNYLVAILTTVYEIMYENGDFFAIEYQYIFITKYLKALEENNGYDKLILFPPPMNIFITPLILVSPSREYTKKFSRYLWNIIYWMENIILLIFFFLYMFSHNPLIIIKQYYQFSKIDGTFNKIFSMFLWTIFGLFFLIYVNLVDMCMLMNILCLDNSVQFDQGEEEKLKLERHKYYIYRDIIRAMKQLLELADGTSYVFTKRQNMQRLLTSKISFSKKLRQPEIEIRPDDLYIVRKEIIIAAYMQISNENPYIRAYRQRYSIYSKRKSSQALLSSIDYNNQFNREQFKENPEISFQLKNLVSKVMLGQNKDSVQELLDFMEQEKQDNNYLVITEDESKLVHNFIDRFIFVNKNQESTSLNLQLATKTFPKTFTPQHIYKLDLLHFSRMQKCLITFFNDDQDEMFNYYDNRMKRRLNSLHRNSSINSRRINRILELTKYVLDYISWEDAINKIKKELTKQLTQNIADGIRAESAKARKRFSSKKKRKRQSRQSTFKSRKSFRDDEFDELESTQQNQEDQSSDGSEEDDEQILEEDGGGFEMLIREQQKNIQKLMSIKNKSQNQANTQQRLTAGAQNLINATQRISFINVPVNQYLGIPSAEEILERIRSKRKEKKVGMSREYSRDEQEITYTDQSQDVRRKVFKNKNNEDYKRKQTKNSYIARQVDDSFHSDSDDAS